MQVHQIAQPSSFTIKASLPPSILLAHQIQTKTHFQKPIVSAKWGKRRSGSQRSHKLIIDSIAFVASNLKILPEPLDSLVREFWVVGGGGNGGKFWSKNGFGGGDGRRSRKNQIGFWVLLMISSGLALCVVLERERESDLLFWISVVVFAFAVLFSLKGWRREIKEWVLGFSCGAALMGLGLKNNENLVKWVDRFRAKSPRFMVITNKRLKGRRWI